ncbi:hypothetical protein [Streptomyces sp. NPDC001401]|uniref:hypothetical protein n=1 Tax=Streptomyces sp. NPDC001401 TaxID=3364570 RepID=UPI00369340CB
MKRVQEFSAQLPGEPSPSTDTEAVDSVLPDLQDTPVDDLWIMGERTLGRLLPARRPGHIGFNSAI